METETDTPHIKKIGHNKLQLEIEQLKSEIDKHIYANNEKEMKLSLFKKTISQLQQQLQEKHQEIQLLNNTQPQTPVVISNNLEKVDDLSNKLSLQISINDNTNTELADLKKNNSLLQEDIVNLNDTIIILKSNIDSQVLNYNNLKTKFDESHSRNTQLSNINNSLEKEISFIKDELLRCKQTLELNKEHLRDLIEAEQIPQENPQEIIQQAPLGVVRKKLTRGDKRRR